MIQGGVKLKGQQEAGFRLIALSTIPVQKLSVVHQPIEQVQTGVCGISGQQLIDLPCGVPEPPFIQRLNNRLGGFFVG